MYWFFFVLVPVCCLLCVSNLCRLFSLCRSPFLCRGVLFGIFAFLRSYHSVVVANALLSILLAVFSLIYTFLFRCFLVVLEDLLSILSLVSMFRVCSRMHWSDIFFFWCMKYGFQDDGVSYKRWPWQFYSLLSWSYIWLSHIIFVSILLQSFYLWESDVLIYRKTKFV